MWHVYVEKLLDYGVHRVPLHPVCHISDKLIVLVAFCDDKPSYRPFIKYHFGVYQRQDSTTLEVRRSNHSARSHPLLG